VDWQWQSADAAMAKARFGGDEIGPNPTDRAKPGTKRSLLVEADGGPLAVVIGGANVHDCKLLEATLDAIVLERPNPQKVEQHLCLDKGYDNPTGRTAVNKHQYIPHLRRIGEEKLDEQQQKRYPARRWVVERTLGWLSKCRAILVRYDKKACNYLGMIKIACALLWYRRCWRLSNSNLFSH
jgi:putative transposase